MQALEPIQFGDFVRAYGGSAELAQDVPQSFYTSPSVYYFPKSEFRRKEFAKDHVNGAVGAIFQHVIHPVSRDTGDYSKETYRSMVEAFGYDLASGDQMKTFWFERAATFELCPYGSCAWRASYAAVKVARVFQNTSLKIFLKSAETKDQFTVVLGNKARGWFVYDPLTNPDVFFPVELYNKKIIGTFSDRRAGARQFSLQITPELVDEYTAVCPRIKKLYLSYCDSTPVTVERLKNDPAFIGGFRLSRVEPKQYDTVCEKAIKIFNEVVNKQRHAL